MFLQPQYELDLEVAREQLCYGISIDETFKVAVKCRVKTEGGKYAAVSYCLHTVHSSCTQIAVACRFMRTKSAMDKAVCIKQILFSTGCCRGSWAHCTANCLCGN